MKKIILILMIVFAQLSFAQKNNLDPKLFGSWSGTEKDNQVMGMTKNWIMHRFEDGKFVLLFTVVENGEVSNFSETGKWWVENNTFYEYHNNSKSTDVYNYTVLDENHVKFKMKKAGVQHENVDYEFIDTRLEDNL